MMRSLASVILGLVLAGSAVTVLAEQSATAENPLVVRVEEFHTALVAMMKSTAPPDARALTLEEVVDTLFDVATISRISLGRTWPTLDSAAKAQFASRLRRLITVTYVDRFGDFNNQEFATVGVQEAPRGWVVKTELTRANGGIVPLDYYFREDKVYNVVADGVSDLSLRRADYSSIIKEQGYEGLLAHIDASIESQAGDSEP